VSDATPWVFVVDDDPSVRKALARLLQSADLQTETFPSAAAFLDHSRPDVPSCLILDVQMPEVDGLDLQRSLSDDPISLPIVFITGHGDIPKTVRALKAGAVDFLPKPFEDEVLLGAVQQAIAQDRQDRATRADVSTIKERVASLSPREHEVMGYVVSGLLNKQIARRLGVKEKTIKVHRGQVMRKMQAGSVAELVRMAEKVGIASQRD
jgi:FixJ family two-component response regulator